MWVWMRSTWVEDHGEVDVIHGAEFWGRRKKAGDNQWHKIDIYIQLGRVRECLVEVPRLFELPSRILFFQTFQGQMYFCISA